MARNTPTFLVAEASPASRQASRRFRRTRIAHKAPVERARNRLSVYVALRKNAVGKKAKARTLPRATVRPQPCSAIWYRK